MTQRGYGYSVAETALCIWEAMLEARLAADLSDDPRPSALETAWEERGTITMRAAAIRLAPAADAIWQLLSPEEQDELDCYDWEFIPLFVERVDWDALYVSDKDYPRLAREIASAGRAKHV